MSATLAARLRSFTLCAFTLLLGSCSEVSILGTEDPDLDGVVTAVHEDGGQLRVLVGGLTLPSQGYSQIDLTILGPGVDAPIYVRTESAGLVRGSRADVMVGARVQAWNTGGERRSDPPQWDAERIEVSAARE